MYDVLILAGGINSQQLEEMSQTAYEALIDIAGQPMVMHVVDALLACEQIGRVMIVGPCHELSTLGLPPAVMVTQSGPSVTDNLLRGLRELGPCGRLLIVTADIPMLTPGAVQDFIAQCHALPGELFYPIVSKEVNVNLYPAVQRTYVTLQEGTFTGGNMFMVDSAVIPRCIALTTDLIEQRKRPWRMCSILGWRFVLKLLLRQLNLTELEQRVSALLNITARAVVSNYPEVGLDVDKPSDLDLVRRVYHPAKGGTTRYGIQS